MDSLLPVLGQPGAAAERSAPSVEAAPQAAFAGPFGLAFWKAGGDAQVAEGDAEDAGAPPPAQGAPLVTPIALGPPVASLAAGSDGSLRNANAVAALAGFLGMAAPGTAPDVTPPAPDVGVAMPRDGAEPSGAPAGPPDTAAAQTAKASLGGGTPSAVAASISVPTETPVAEGIATAEAGGTGKPSLGDAPAPLPRPTGAGLLAGGASPVQNTASKPDAAVLASVPGAVTVRNPSAAETDMTRVSPAPRPGGATGPATSAPERTPAAMAVPTGSGTAPRPAPPAGPVVGSSDAGPEGTVSQTGKAAPAGMAAPPGMPANTQAAAPLPAAEAAPFATEPAGEATGPSEKRPASAGDLGPAAPVRPLAGPSPAPGMPNTAATGAPPHAETDRDISAGDVRDRTTPAKAGYAASLPDMRPVPRPAMAPALPHVSTDMPVSATSSAEVDPAALLSTTASGVSSSGQLPAQPGGGSGALLAQGAAQTLAANLPSPLPIMTLSILAERPETADLMRRHLDILAQEFSRSGLEPPQVRIGGGSADGSAQHGGGDQGAKGEVRRETGHAASPPPHVGTGALRALDLRL
jgi:flagellar hook-length control protein FliK